MGGGQKAEVGLRLWPALPAVNAGDFEPKLMAQIFDAVVEAEAAEGSPKIQLISLATA
jgi:hypothetical protein